MVFSGRQALDGADIVSLLPDEVRLQTAAGQSVQLSGDPTEGVESGSSFAGTLALPAETSNDINVAVEFSLDQAHPDLLAQLPEAAPAVPIDGVSELGQEILAASEALNASLAVVEATIAPPSVRRGAASAGACRGRHHRDPALRSVGIRHLRFRREHSRTNTRHLLGVTVERAGREHFEAAGRTAFRVWLGL